MIFFSFVFFASPSRSHWLLVCSWGVYWFFGCPLPLHQQEALFWNNRKPSMPGAMKEKKALWREDWNPRRKGFGWSQPTELFWNSILCWRQLHLYPLAVPVWGGGSWAPRCLSPRDQCGPQSQSPNHSAQLGDEDSFYNQGFEDSYATDSSCMWSPEASFFAFRSFLVCVVCSLASSGSPIPSPLTLPCPSRKCFSKKETLPWKPKIFM